MDTRLRNRIIMFYVAGILNAFFGLYVLIEGPSFLPPENVTWLAIVFLVFAAVNFYFPRAMRKKWEEDLARRRAGQSGTSNQARSQK